MCQVFDKSETGIINLRVGIVTAFKHRYGEILGDKVYSKIRNKKKSCSKRGIDFKLTWEILDLLIDKWILGEGVCDYTVEGFILEHNHEQSPTLERINSSLPYQEGNLCVITKKVNSYKGIIEDAVGTAFTIREESRELFNKMFTTINNLDKMIEIRDQYIPNKQEKEMTTETNNVVVSTISSTQAEVPEDIQISKVYYTLMNFFLNSGKVVNITFAQFRRLYKFKNCFLSGQAMTADNKSPLLLDDEVTKDTLRFAIEDYATPFQTLIDKKGMTPTLLMNMLNKNIK